MTKRMMMDMIHIIINVISIVVGIGLLIYIIFYL